MPSCCGVIGNVIMIALLLFLCIPITSSYLNGIEHMSFFTSQLPISTNLYIPDTFKLAIVFYDKITQTVANHTQISSIATLNTFLNNIQGNTFKDGVQACDPNYFSNTINPPTLTDCFMFTNKKLIEMISSTTNPVSFGFVTSFRCSNPFSCATGTASHTTATNNFADVFTNYTYTLYFTAKVFSNNGDVHEQTFSVSSS